MTWPQNVSGSAWHRCSVTRPSRSVPVTAGGAAPVLAAAVLAAAVLAAAVLAAAVLAAAVLAATVLA
ncbi:MAG TPA: hypothetical protein DEH11_19600, partial [Actinobacteria bacterium]|nr:hypothetical protein [Actinomycetota bacterium]